MTNDPIAQFNSWLQEARRHPDIIEPTAACLATVSAGGQPSARMVLVKEADARGFAFYTNFESRKARELLANPKAALCFYWGALGRQVRVEGMVEKVSDAEADAYFATRHRDSQIGAWASKQSSVLSGREELERAVAETAKKFAGKEVKRPPHWSGWRVIPQVIEFWQQGENRLHEREVFTKKGEGWEAKKLYP